MGNTQHAVTDLPEKVRRIVGVLAGVPCGNPPADARLVEDLGYDSVRLLELSIALEEAFGLDGLSVEHTLSIRTVANVEERVRALVERPPS